MSKLRLIRMSWTDFNSSYIEWILKDYFTLEIYNPSSTYTREDCIFVASRRTHWQEEITEKYLSQGFRLILANPWEARPFFSAKEFEPYLSNILVILGCANSYDYGWTNRLDIPNWFWYNESLWYTCESRMQFQNYIPNRTNNKLFFMPIKRSKPFRTEIVEKLEEFLDNATWSYVERFCDGKHLVTRDVNPVQKIGWDRQFEEEWYNDTYFTLAVETSVGTQYDLTKEINNLRTDDVPCDLFVTEKTFKPIAFQHPFMVCAMKGTLNFLHNLGFETYEHIFDESYDQLDFFEDRLDIIYNNIKQFDKSKYLDPLTMKKIQHNYNRFYDRSAVLDGVKKDLIDPLLEWINGN